MIHTCGWKRTGWQLALAAALLVSTAGCNGKEHKDLGGGTAKADQHALYDRDSRNNEDNTLGVKSKYVEEQARTSRPDNPGALQQLDMTNHHLSKTFRFAPEISKHLEQLPGVSEADVLITEANAYVGLVMDGHEVDKEANPDMMAHKITPKGGVGLFGTDKGAGRINWGDPGGLTYSLSSRITGQVLNMTQPGVQRVFVSANPNFVQRLRFYSKEDQSGVDVSAYMNEFNTMTQRVFPSDHNTRR
ncbi:YhcN/YlaJ family sporulation lipoprotein [Paenibacillus sp. TAB 01]|uniref:YhcN/YlaJ family sporulation lipoprotein n=1 Tax=Paenibacillus sp. TAB 01 TaxID=3368988 RepID=UPI0037516967